MPKTQLGSVAEAQEQFARWLESAPDTGFLFHTRTDGRTGELSRMALVAVGEAPEGEAPAARYLASRDEALQAVREGIARVGNGRTLLREWLDVSIELEVLPGHSVQGLLVRQFSLVGLHANSQTRGADGSSTLRALAHVTRIENDEECSLSLPVKVVTDDGQPVPQKRPQAMTVPFAAGQLDRYMISRLRLQTPSPGRYRVQLCSPDGDETLWELPLEVNANPVSPQRTDAPETNGQDEEEGLLE